MYLKQIIDYFKSLIEDGMAVDYGLEEIEQCKAILTTYKSALESTKNLTDDSIMEHVKNCVFSLNELNESCDYSLIETEEREMLWEFIQTTAIAHGLKNYTDDITEDYRDW